MFQDILFSEVDYLESVLVQPDIFLSCSLDELTDGIAGNRFVHQHLNDKPSPNIIMLLCLMITVMALMQLMETMDPYYNAMQNITVDIVSD